MGTLQTHQTPVCHHEQFPAWTLLGKVAKSQSPARVWQIRLSKGRLIWLYRSLTCTSFSELSKGYTSSYCEKKLQSCFYKFARTKSFRNLLNCQTVIYFCITCNTSCLASLTCNPFFLPKALQCSSIGDMVATVVDPLCVEGTGDVTVVTVTAGFFRRLEALVDSATAESPETNGCLAGIAGVFNTSVKRRLV